ncbi:hypothetical protein NQ317_018460 [Molorchus minor]|uniref:Uncharacterized protein n=1 Tax=Molorchus minor TaxID=1323400 RepID=A0ABQ9J6J3_9CUCU|nr:hypothetical protein NQ317_018460 [Molorchus minor]
MAENKGEKHEATKEEDSPPDGGYGWAIVFAIVLINSSVLTLVQCFGIIFKDEFSSMQISAAETSFLLHLHSSIFCCFGFFGSPLLKKYGFRVSAFFGASLMCLGILLSSFANSYIFLIFSISILIGRKYTVLILFGVSLLSFVGCFLFKPLKKGENNVELLRNNDKTNAINREENEEVCDKLMDPKAIYKDTTIPVNKNKSILGKIYEIFDLELLKQLPYVLVVIGLGISFAAELNIVLMMQFLLPELSELKRSAVADVTSVQYVFDITGRLVVPFLAHTCDVAPKIMYGGSLVVATISRTVLATWGKSHIVVFICCSILGLTKGSRAVFQSVIIPKYVPLDKVPAATGLNMLFNGLVSLAVGPIIGAIHDSTNSYVPALHAASALSCVCVLLWTFEYFFHKSKTVNNE